MTMSIDSSGMMERIEFTLKLCLISVFASQTPKDAKSPENKYWLCDGVYSIVQLSQQCLEASATSCCIIGSGWRPLCKHYMYDSNKYRFSGSKS